MFLIKNRKYNIIRTLYRLNIHELLLSLYILSSEETRTAETFGLIKM